VRRATLALLALLSAAAIAPPAGAAPATTTTSAPGVQLPPVTRAKLKNGLTVLILPTRRLPLVDYALVCRAGSVYDPPGKEGVAGLTADLLTQGAGARSAQQIAEDIAFVGGTLDADADAEGLDVDCEVLRKDFDTGLALFRDVIVSPTFPADAFERRQQETLGALASDKDDPGTVADRALLPFVYGKSPLAHDADGWTASVTKLTRDDIVAFHHRLVTPDNATLAVVGDVEPQAALAAIEAAFKDWKPSGTPTPIPYAPVTAGGGRAVRIVAKPEVTQTQIRFACPGVARNHPDYFPIRVANTILGAGFTSRLVNEIRVTRGLT
jgi:zinc protease